MVSSGAAGHSGNVVRGVLPETESACSCSGSCSGSCADSGRAPSEEDDHKNAASSSSATVVRCPPLLAKPAKAPGTVSFFRYNHVVIQCVAKKRRSLFVF